MLFLTLIEVVPIRDTICNKIVPVKGRYSDVAYGCMCNKICKMFEIGQ